MNTLATFHKPKTEAKTQTLPQFKQMAEEALSRFLKQHHAHLPNNLLALAVAAVEEPLLRLVLEETNYNQSQAAKILGINRATLRKKMQEHQIG